MFAVCLKYSRNYEDAEDTLQDSFVTIFNKIDKYSYKGSFEGWIKRITINTAIEKFRNNNGLQLVKEEEVKEEMTDVVIDEEAIAIDDLLKFIQDLPDKYRLVFNLYVLDNYSHKEIAELLKISIGGSKSNLSRARALLKQKVEAHKKYQKEA